MTEISKEAREAANECVDRFTYSNDSSWCDFVAEAIQEALDAEKANQGWQPINDAPMGGVEFQAWIQSYGWEPACRFNPETDAFEIFGRVDFDQDGWDVYPHMIPTHYMDLPKGPVE